MHNRRFSRFLICLCALMTAVAPLSAPAAENAPVSVTARIASDSVNMLKYGNPDLDITPAELYAVFAPGDIVTVSAEGFGAWDMPLCKNYNDVPAGAMLLRAADGKDVSTVAVNYGAAGESMGIAEKAPEGSPYAYRPKDGVPFPVTVTVTLKEAGGYAEQLRLGSLHRSDVYEDYPDLTPAEYANFRDAAAGGILPGRLYRSSSPINPQIGRSVFAEAAAREADVRTFLNLSDTEEIAAAYPGYADSCCASRTMRCFSLSLAITGSAFREGVAGVFRAVADGDAPFLVFCVEGKDRTGFVCAVLQALCGASADEIREDYLKTYLNFYDVRDGRHITPDPAAQEAVRDTAVSTLGVCFGTEIGADTDLRAAAEAYLLDIGVSAEEIALIREKLTAEP